MCIECGRDSIFNKSRSICETCYRRRREHGNLDEPVARSPENGNYCRCGCGRFVYYPGRHWERGHRKGIKECLCGCGTPLPGHAIWVKGHENKRRKGKPGLAASAEARAKMSEAHKGKPKSAAHRANIAAALRRGSATAARSRKLLRKWAVYGEWRDKVFARDSYTCQECGARATRGNPVRLHAHHIASVAESPGLMLSVANGRTLCVTCHKKTPSYGRMAHKVVLQMPLDILS